MRVVAQKIMESMGLILLSALSILLSFFILQPLANFLDPTFNLLANRGVGKVAFVFVIIFQIFLLLITQSKVFFSNFIEINFKFIKEKGCLKSFFSYFITFFLLHGLLLLFLYLLGFIFYNPNWGSWSLSLLFKLLFGFIVVLLLAWTEELIFRGTLYLYFLQYLTKINSIILTSIIFMFAHNLSNPLALVTKDWKLGLGLFLLGVLLNINFYCTQKLYTNMGIHAGLVFVKVLLRRIPFIQFLPPNQLPFWINKDLRMSFLVHLLFVIAIIVYGVRNKKS